jgi:predicted ribosome quality control (RQC) complex YloA/Tae2 family protein
LDRLFLRKLVDELSPGLIGRRIRSAAVDRAARLFFLELAPPRPSTLVLSYLREAPGAFLSKERPPRERAATPGSKRLASTRIVSFGMAELDRVLTLALEGQRPSGRRTALRLIVEVIGARADLFLVDEETGGVIEVFSSGRSRLGPGDRYELPSPPPSAMPLAENAGEVERRLAQGSPALALGQALLAATGTTPLLVREIEWRMEREGESAGEAFAKVRARLEEKRPFLYAPAEGSTHAHTLLSPLELSTVGEDLRPREQESFSSALADAVAIESEARALSTARGRLESALERERDRLHRLDEKLAAEESAREDPDELRRRGELLLAGLSRARRSADGKTVALPDLFAPVEQETEIEIDPRRSLPKNAERFFDRARRAERRAVELAKRRESVGKEIARWEAFAFDLRDAGTLEEVETLAREAAEEGLPLPESAKPAPKKRPAEPLGPRRFLTGRGRDILVGRSGRSNDELTFAIASPQDLWLHARGVPGAHVVLRVPPGERPEEAEILEAAELAAYFSKSREDTRVDVIVTERRHVSRIRGAPRGLVKVSPATETRTVRVAPRPPRTQASDRP